MKSIKPYKRVDRVGKQILDVLANILIKEIDFTYLGFVSFNKVVIAPDLKSAKVFYTVLNPKLSHEKISIEINKRHKVFKKYMTPELKLKNIPDLKFFYDNSYDYSEKIQKILDTVGVKGKDN